MNTLEYIRKKYNITDEMTNGSMPIKLGIDRFKELTTLFKELGFKCGAEIGVANGRYSKWLCARNKGLNLYCIDPWESYSEYVEHHDKDDKILDTCYEQARKRLKPYNCEFIRKYSMDAVKDFEDESLDFVYIDGNHSYQYVVNDIAEWSKKVRVGGIIAGHDFWNSSDRKIGDRWMGDVKTEEERIKLCQVPDAVKGWTNANKIKPWFIITKKGCPSFFWVKEK